MFFQSSTKSEQSGSVSLKASHQLPLLIIFLGIGSFPLISYLWLSIIISIFGIFLLVQSFILRLEFTPDDLIVWQLDRELRRFPFKSWIAWRIFLPKLPGILYFREEASPHLLPILFDPEELENQLKSKVGSLEMPKKSNNKAS